MESIQTIKPKIFVTRPLPQVGLDQLASKCEMDLWPLDTPPPRAQLIEHLKEAQGLLCLLTDRIDEEVLNNAPNLKVVSNYAVGFDNIDINACSLKKIPVGNTPEVLSDTTADFAFALMMTASRLIVPSREFALSGQWVTWSPTLFLGQDIHHSTIGLIGLGRIGRRMIKRAQGFDMKVIFYDPMIKETEVDGAIAVSFEKLCQESDFISLHCPLTPETRNIINQQALLLMKDTVVIVNTSRGACINTNDLYQFLLSHPLSNAGLDVTDPEPLPCNNPLYNCKNCLIVPHIGSASVKTRDKMALMAVDNLLKGLKGEKLSYCVNPNIY